MRISFGNLLAISLFTVSVIGCSSYDRRLSDNSTMYIGANGGIVKKSGAPVDTVSYWDGDGVSGAPSIVINLSEQKAFYYKGGKLVGISAISTGREGFQTPAGSFKIIQKDLHHASTLYGDYVDAAGTAVVKNVDVTKDPKPPGTTFVGAPMPFFMRIHNGVGMHQGFLPGVPDSHGCIRMPQKMAEIFWANTPQGTPVRITY
ncbi:MAG: L,D-transpeptidase family protein [Chthoniobacterales bacterium]